MGQGENKKLIVITPSGCKEMAIEQRIKEIIERELPNSKANIERDTDSEKVGGRVIWAGFAGNTSLRRQNRIFGLLRRELSTSEARDISFIFTYTPDEYEQLQAA